MSRLTEYTTYGTVRAVLGATTREIPDETLANELYILALLENLRTVGVSVGSSLDLTTDYLANWPAPATTTATNFVNAVRLYSAHVVARECLKALPGLAPDFITDGKASLKKVRAETYARVEADYMTYRRKLQELYATFSDASAPTAFNATLMGVSSPTYDPVIGE